VTTSTSLTPLVSLEEEVADYLTANAETPFDWQQLQTVAFNAGTWSHDWMVDNIRTIRAYARLSGYIIPWPSAENNYAWIATRDDGTRRTGSDLQFRHISTHLREELADYEVMRAIVAHRHPVDVRFLQGINNYITSLIATLAYRDNMADIALIMRPQGWTPRRTGPSPRRHPRLVS